MNLMCDFDHSPYFRLVLLTTRLLECHRVDMKRHFVCCLLIKLYGRNSDVDFGFIELCAAIYLW